MVKRLTKQDPELTSAVSLLTELADSSKLILVGLFQQPCFEGKVLNEFLQESSKRTFQEIDSALDEMETKLRRLDQVSNVHPESCRRR